ncbi:hypothetical protein LY284_34375 [Caballeronia sp. PC1]|nr:MULTISPECIES: hypothetical protein [unclassified Caballeronia]MCE4547444.1 hypothetical protein [Caballeronia sp. PC1]MCE4575430.1 hypothetical protein [Caballeronia sp. CLC5]
MKTRREFKAVWPRHIDIEHSDVGRPRLDALERHVSAESETRFVTCLRQRESDRLGSEGVVVND